VIGDRKSKLAGEIDEAVPRKLLGRELIFSDYADHPITAINRSPDSS
jgi:hypothetical protein